MPVAEKKIWEPKIEHSLMKYSITNVFEDAKEKMCRKAPCDKKACVVLQLATIFSFLECTIMVLISNGSIIFNK